MIRASDFSKKNSGGFDFGIEPERVRAGLLKLLEKLEKGQLIVQQVTTTEVASNEEFLTKDLIIRFNEKEIK